MAMNSKMVVAVCCALVLQCGESRAADADMEQALSVCRALSNNSDRLSCYDRILPSPSNAAESSNAQVLEELGSEQLPRTDEQIAEDNTTVIAHVTRCTRATNKKYVFYLESGQVWRQKSDKRLFFKDCRFEVEISKDFFGYRMSKVGESSRFRVSRVR